MSDFPLPAAAETVRRVREDPNRLGHRDPHAHEEVEGAGHGRPARRTGGSSSATASGSSS